MLTKYVQGNSIYVVLGTFVIIFLTYLIANKRKKVPKPLDIHLLNKRILEYKPESIINPTLTYPLRNKRLELHTPNESNPACLNLAKVNYLDLLNNEHIKQKAEECIRKYGVGSCGPRGFYGTIDVHLDLETRIANFMGLEETVLYSYGFSTISSAIGAYCKKSDIVFCAENAHFAIQQGLLAAKSTVVYFSCDDLNDFENLLKEYERKEKRRNKLFRKFMIVEGINSKTGKICPLPQLMEIRKKYKLRIFLDESISFGVLGATGRGITEHYNIDRTDVDMIMGSLEGSLGSIGGFCVGASVVIEHQRLSGLGYCFSASLPPFLSYIAICAIDLFQDNPKMFEKLKDISIIMDEKLRTIPEINVLSDPLSPKKVIQLKEKNASVETLHKLCSEQDMHMLKFEDLLHLNLNVNFTQEQLDRVIEILSNACKALA